MVELETSSVELNKNRLLRIWWCYFWRTVVCGALIGLVLGAIGGFIVGLLGKPELGGHVGTLLGYAGQVPVSILVLKSVLQKRFKEFSIRLVSNG